MVRYNRELPFVSLLSRLCERAAQRDGYLTLYDGARRHFDQWAPGGRWKAGAGPCARDEALRRVTDPHHPWYGKQLWRADCRKAMNALIQGSGARHTKRWMLACWRENIVPLLQMHDALDCSVSSPEQAQRVAQLGCEAVQLEVPMRIDVAFGRNWGDAKHTWAELHAETGSHVEPVGELLPDDRERTQRGTPIFFNDSGRASNPADLSPPAEPPHICIHCRLNPPDGTERTFGVDNVWIHPRCEDVYIHARMLEEGILSESAAAVSPPRPQAPPPQATPTPSSGNGYGDFASSSVIATICCPIHEDWEPSCALYDDGHYHCFGCGAHGLTEDLELEDDELTQPAAHTEPAAESDARKFKLALRLWDEGKPIAGTLAAHYLTNTRKLELSALPGNVDEVLRFHPRCVFGDNGMRHPCLLALFRDVEDDAPAGIHRIGLTADAKKIERLTLGRWPKVRAIKLWPATNRLSIGEGVETVLGAIRCGAITPPAWAVGGKANIAKFPVLPGIKALTILVDNDGRQALPDAEACATRYLAAGCRVRMLITDDVKDFNDLVVS
jgi:hypothetical protein